MGEEKKYIPSEFEKSVIEDSGENLTGSFGGMSEVVKSYRERNKLGQFRERPSSEKNLTDWTEMVALIESGQVESLNITSSEREQVMSMDKFYGERLKPLWQQDLMDKNLSSFYANYFLTENGRKDLAHLIEGLMGEERVLAGMDDYEEFVTDSREDPSSFDEVSYRFKTLVDYFRQKFADTQKIKDFFLNNRVNFNEYAKDSEFLGKFNTLKTSSSDHFTNGVQDQL